MRLFAKQKAQDGRGFVGVFGFSQGSRVASGLLLEQQCGKKHVAGEGLSFGVFTMGTFPPLTFELTEEERQRRIAFPTLNVVGSTDPYRKSSLELYQSHCEKEMASFREYDVGHRLPTGEDDSAEIAQEILRMHLETSRGELVELGNGVA
jgi:hypothetical protein